MKWEDRGSNSASHLLWQWLRPWLCFWGSPCMFTPLTTPRCRGSWVRIPRRALCDIRPDSPRTLWNMRALLTSFFLSYPESVLAAKPSKGKLVLGGRHNCKNITDYSVLLLCLCLFKLYASTHWRKFVKYGFSMTRSAFERQREQNLGLPPEKSLEQHEVRASTASRKGGGGMTTSNKNNLNWNWTLKRLGGDIYLLFIFLFSEFKMATWTNIFLILFICLFWFFKNGFLCIVLTILELTL